MFDLAEEAFDEVAFFVDVAVVRDRRRARGCGWYDRLSPEGQICPDPVGVICLIGDDVLGREAFNQGFGLRAVVDLAGSEKKADRIAERIDGDVDLGAQPAARAAERLNVGPPFPPAACWCARTIVASMMRCSRSGSSLKASRMRDHTPRLAQREKRRNTEFHGPNVSGKSRHGAPVRASQSTDSTNKRLSAP